MNSFELFCEVLFELLLRSLLFSRTFYLRFASSFIALSRGDLFILSLLCPFVNPFFRFLLFLHFISLFLSLFVHFASLFVLFIQKGAVKKKRNKARGFPRYGSPRALIYHTAKKNYLILKKGYSKHTGRKYSAFCRLLKC